MRLQVGVLWTRRANGANLKVTDMDQNTTVCCTVNYRLDRREAKQFAGIISITNVRNGRTTEAYWSGATSSLPAELGWLYRLLFAGGGRCDLTTAQLRSFKHFASEHRPK
jgi:hypothetical protein